MPAVGIARSTMTIGAQTYGGVLGVLLDVVRLARGRCSAERAGQGLDAGKVGTLGGSGLVVHALTARSTAIKPSAQAK